MSSGCEPPTAGSASSVSLMLEIMWSGLVLVSRTSSGGPQLSLLSFAAIWKAGTPGILPGVTSIMGRTWGFERCHPVLLSSLCSWLLPNGRAVRLSYCTMNSPDLVTCYWSKVCTDIVIKSKARRDDGLRRRRVGRWHQVCGSKTAACRAQAVGNSPVWYEVYVLK
jgi:hypothetical protein